VLGTGESKTTEFYSSSISAVNLMNVLHKFNSIFKRTVHSPHVTSREEAADESVLEYYHKKLDPEKNAQTTPPEEEKIRIPALWAFEVYTPSYIASFHRGVSKLGWSEEEAALSPSFQDSLNRFRYKASGSGWINLGHIVDVSEKTSWPGIRKAELPHGIQSIQASLLQFLPSTTILACQFRFKHDLARSIENPLKDVYSTYKEKAKIGYRVIDVLSQKRHAVAVARAYLKKLCTSWLAYNLPGLFSSGCLGVDFPACEFITFEKHVPFQKIEGKSHDNFLWILDLANDFDAWQSDELEGLFLQWPPSNNYQMNNLVLAGNINRILTNKDISDFGQTAEGRILNFLSFIDNSLGRWVLLVIATAFEKRITKLRDSYGEAGIDYLYSGSSISLELDRQILDIQKNTIPFIHELKGFCEQEWLFMHDVFEFKAINDMRKKGDPLFSSIRRSLLSHADLLDRNERSLRNTADANRQIVAVKSSNYLAQTNIALQKRLNWMTFLLLLLTIVLAVSAIPQMKTIFEWLIRLLKSNIL
jgi:hypothetical protein